MVKKTSIAKLTEEEIHEILMANGFTSLEIKQALFQTESRDIEDIIACIHKFSSNSRPNTNITGKEMITNHQKEETARMMEERRIKLLEEKNYRDKLREMIASDKAERQQQESSTTKNVPIPEKEVIKKKADCIVKVRLPCGKSTVLYFKKNDTVSCLFLAITNVFGSNGFEVYLPNHPEPLENNSAAIHTIAELYPNGVVYVK